MSWLPQQLIFHAWLWYICVKHCSVDVMKKKFLFVIIAKWSKLHILESEQTLFFLMYYLGFLKIRLWAIPLPLANCNLGKSSELALKNVKNLANVDFRECTLYICFCTYHEIAIFSTFLVQFNPLWWLLYLIEILLDL